MAVVSYLGFFKNSKFQMLISRDWAPALHCTNCNSSPIRACVPIINLLCYILVHFCIYLCTH